MSTLDIHVGDGFSTGVLFYVQSEVLLLIVGLKASQLNSNVSAVLLKSTASNAGM